jgi:hypothetical protein
MKTALLILFLPIALFLGYLFLYMLAFGILTTLFILFFPY